MLSMIIGVFLVLFAAFACLPKEIFGFGLGWGADVLSFLRGGAPVFAALVGIVAVTLGFTDIQERREAKREEKEALELERKNQPKAEKTGVEKS